MPSPKEPGRAGVFQGGEPKGRSEPASGTGPPEGWRAQRIYFGEKDRVGGFGGGGVGYYVEGGFGIFGHGEGRFSAAGLVTEFHGDVLGAEWRREAVSGRRMVTCRVDVELLFLEGEGCKCLLERCRV